MSNPNGWRELLEAIGVEPRIAIAGFAGALVQFLQWTETRPVRAVSNFFIGILVAVYLGSPIVKVTGLPDLVIGFIVGYAGIWVLNYFLGFVKQKLGVIASNGGPKDA